MSLRGAGNLLLPEAFHLPTYSSTHQCIYLPTTVQPPATCHSRTACPPTHSPISPLGCHLCLSVIYLRGPGTCTLTHVSGSTPGHWLAALSGHAVLMLAAQGQCMYSCPSKEDFGEVCRYGCQDMDSDASSHFRVTRELAWPPPLPSPPAVALHWTCLPRSLACNSAACSEVCMQSPRPCGVMTALRAPEGLRL